MNDKFNVRTNLVILSTDIPKNKKYVLSLDQNNLVLPSFYLDKDNYTNIKESIQKYFQDKLVVSPLELMPSLLFVNPSSLPPQHLEQNTIDLIYGSVIVFNTNIQNIYWQEFDFLLPHPYSNLLFEVVHNLS